MSAGIPLPLHLAVHLVGLASVAGLLAWAISRRRSLGPTWLAFLVGGLLLTAQHVGLGLVVTEGTSWPVYARAMAYASLAVGIAGASGRSSVGLPVVVAIAPIAVHVTAGLAGLLAAASAVRGTLRRGGLLGSGIALWATSDMLVRSRPALAAWIALGGSLAVFGWSATVGQTSVRARLLAVTTLLVSLVVVLISAATGTLFADQLRQEAIDRLRQPAAVIVDDLQQTWPTELAGQLRTTAKLPTVVEVFRRLGGEAQQTELAELVRQTGTMDLVVLLDRNGIAQAASWRNGPAPVTWLPILQGHPAVVAAATAPDSQVGTALLRADGATRSTVAAFAAAVVLPNATAGIDERLGILVAARLVDDADLQRRSRAAAADMVVLAAGDIIQSTRSTNDDDAIEAGVAAGRTRVEVSGGTELLLASLDGGVVGVPITIGVLDDIGALGDPEGVTARDLFLRSLFVMALALLAGAMASRWLARPVTQLTAAVDRVAEGDLDTAFGMEDRGDEFGRLAEAFEGMTVSLSARQAALQRAASTEAELRGRLQAITDSMSDGLLATDRHGYVTAANPAVARLLGLDTPDLLGRSLGDVLLGQREGSDENLADAVAAATGKGRPFSGRGLVSTTNLHVDVTSSPLRGTDGEAPVVGTVVVLRDVSAEAELARARRDFVTNISHELRTPLTLIMAPVKQLERWRTNESIAPLQSEILNRGTARMARLERELTEWAQIELGRYANVKGTADLAEVRKRSVDMVSWQFPEREIRVKVPVRLKKIAVSNEAVQTIVRELTHNAVLFSKHDAKPVDVVFKNVAEGVELTVTDRGVGMDEATLARAFEPYWQRDASERRDFDGLGIGLPLAQRVAQAAGTDVTLTSRPGRGTTARVVFPVH